MSAVWDSRFDDADDKTNAACQNLQNSGKIDLAKILDVARSALPLMDPSALKHDDRLGRGASWEVNKEIFSPPNGERGALPYYVAVKHVLTSRQTPERSRKLFDEVMRELHVLTHAKLHHHSSIISTLAYGWTVDAFSDPRPYLVVEYSDHGTLRHYLQTQFHPLDDRRELMLDIAAGIQSLHENRILHGDIKAENVLLFDADIPSGQGDTWRAQVAKLADFGHAIFDTEGNGQTLNYLGTSIYNAPEVEGRCGSNVINGQLTFDLCRKSEIFSYGLLVWEIMSSGGVYLDNEWFRAEETRIEFLERVCATEQNGLLRRGKDFFQSNPFINAPREIMRIAEQVLDMTLLDNAHERADIQAVRRVLGEGISDNRPYFGYRSIRTGPPEPAREFVHRNVSSSTWYQLSDEKTRFQIEGEKIFQQSLTRVTDEASLHPYSDERYGLVPIVKQPPPKRPDKVDDQSFNMFKAPLFTGPPWEVQCTITENLLHDAHSSRNPAQQAYTSLQLSICYYLGFGIKPDMSKALFYLGTAVKEKNRVAESIHRRVFQALVPLLPSIHLSDILPNPDIDPVGRETTPESYFASQIWSTPYDSDEELSGDLGADDQDVDENDTWIKTLNESLKPGNISSLRQLLPFDRLTSEQWSLALTSACRLGHFDTVRYLARSCPLLEHNGKSTTPLHWLIMFDEKKACALAHLLVKGSSGKPGVCQMLLNAIPRQNAWLPKHCLELLGAPLHWAVRARNLALVKTLIDLGADVNLRWTGLQTSIHEPRSTQLPSFSPLDIAAMYHYPEIAETLLEHDAKMYGGSFEEKHSAFHLLGQPVAAFSRFIMHGREYRQALRDTIQILLRWSTDIHVADSSDATPLSAALQNVDQDLYVLEELLSAGARVDVGTDYDRDTAATSFARTGFDRLFNDSKFELLVPLVANINKLDGAGRNALHYCAITGSSAMAEVLLRDTRVEINIRAKGGQTPAVLAAMFGNAEVLQALIQAGADIEKEDSDGWVPLETALRRRHTKAAEVLIKAGANLYLRQDKGGRDTALHVTVADGVNGDSLVEWFIDKCPGFKNSELLNSRGRYGWTALHRAVDQGDLESVRALLKAKAKSIYTVLPSSSEIGFRNNSLFLLPPANMARNSLKTAQGDGRKGVLENFPRIKKGGPSALAHHIASLKEIVSLLEDEMVPDSEQITADLELL
ncbi:MAG: hypothetical protein Q9157_006403 [Trypethelium eluteriae]